MRRAAAPVGLLAPFDLGLLRRDLAFEVALAHAERPDHPRVQHPDAGRDRADRELGVAGRSHLAGDDDVEGHAELARDHVTDDHPAPGDREDERVRFEVPERLRQAFARVLPVGEDHRSSSISRRASSWSSSRRLSGTMRSGGGIGFRMRR